MPESDGGVSHRGLRALFAFLALVVPMLIGYDITFQRSTGALDFSIDRETGRVTHVPQQSFGDWAGLMVGDVIASVEGIPFPAWETTVPGNYRIEVERHGRRLVLELPVVPLAQINRVPLISGVMTALVLWAVGTVLLWRRFRRGDVRIFFLLSQVAAVAALFLLAHPAKTRTLWMTRLSVTCFQFGATLLLHHILTFPVRLGTMRSRRVGLALVYGATAIVALGTWLDLWYRLGLLASALEVLFALGLLVTVYVRRASPDERRRLRLILFGDVTAGLSLVGLFILPSIVELSFPLPIWTAGFFLIIAPLSYLIATARHNLFDIDRLLNRAVVYVLLSMGILLLFLGPFLLIYRFLPGDPMAQLLVVSALTLLVGLAFDWSKMQVQQLVDWIFYGGWYDYAGVVETVSAELARSIDREQLAAVLAQRVPALMRLHPGQLWIGEAVAELNPDPSQPDLWFDLAFEGQLVAVWVVRPHRDGEDFTAADRRILRTLADQAEIAMSNVLLVEVLRQRLEEIRVSRESLARAQRRLLLSREEERARLARELHDGPVQSLVGLNLQLGLLLSSASAGDGANLALVEELAAMRAEVRDLLAEVRAVCAALRPPMLDTLGLGAALRALTGEWSAESEVPVDLDLPPDEDMGSLTDRMTVNLYRVVQEALSNVARHAGASAVSVRLSVAPDLLTLTIQDDGRGFLVPAHLGQLTAEGHFGLTGIQERVDLIGGSLEVTSAPGQGTTLRVRRDSSTVAQ